MNEDKMDKIKHDDEWFFSIPDEHKEYAILTNEISKATFGKNVEEYKKFKQLKKENLRDHMTDLELIFNMLGERVSTEITRKEEAQGFNENKDVARRGGKIAGNARKETEKELSRSIISEQNFLTEPEGKRRLEGKK